jgi:hypothetical protein
MTFTAVTPSNLQTNRADIRDALMALLASAQAATGSFNQAWRARPAGVGEFPLVYLGAINEPKIVHDMQTRVTTFTGSIVYVDTLALASETGARVDAFLDYMREVMTYNFDILSQKIPGAGKLAQTGVSDVEETWGTNVETTATAIFWTLDMQEGRE